MARACPPNRTSIPVITVASMMPEVLMRPNMLRAFREASGMFMMAAKPRAFCLTYSKTP